MSGKNSEIVFGKRVDGSVNAGEFGVSADFEQQQRFMKAHVNDFLSQLPDGIADLVDPLGDRTGPMARTPHLNFPDQVLRSIGHGAYPITWTGAVRTVTNRAGILAKKVSLAPDGLTPATLFYRLDAHELSTQLAPGHASLDRIDSIFVKIEETLVSETRNFKDAATLAPASQSFYKRRNVTLTKSVVQGTPHASPNAPAAPTGYVRYCDVFVPAAWNTYVAPVNIRDHRIPGRLVHTRYTAKQWNSGTWTVNTDLQLASAASGNIARLELCQQQNPHMSRLLALGAILRTTGGGLKCRVMRFDMAAPFSSAVPVRESVVYNMDSLFTGVVDGHFVPDLSQAPPIWMNGYAAGPAMYEDGTITFAAGLSTMAGLYLEAESNADKVLSVWTVTAEP